MRNKSQSANVRTTVAPSGEPGVELFGRGAETGALVQPGTVVLCGLPDLAYDYEIEVAVEPEPRPRAVISSATIRARPGGGAVTSRQVGRELGLAHLHAVSRLSLQVDRNGSASFRRASLADVRSAMKSSATGPQPTALEELTKAAKAYRRAQERGRPTGADVAAALRCSPSTARKRVRQARLAGLLPPADGTTRPRLA